MNPLLLAIQNEFSDLPSLTEAMQIILRLGMAAVLGGAIGFEREKTGKSAGLRTHVLVCMGTAFTVLVPSLSNIHEDGMSRILQGILTGIGFIGAGTILKDATRGKIEGLTTSASIWFTAAIGISVGLGREATALLGTTFAFIVLYFIPHISNKKTEAGTPG